MEINCMVKGTVKNDCYSHVIRMCQRTGRYDNLLVLAIPSPLSVMLGYEIFNF